MASPQDVDVFRTLTKADLIAYWHATFDVNSPRRRKLCSQFFPSKVELPARKATGFGGRKVHYVDGLDEVTEYKRTLAVFPCTPRGDREGSLSAGGWH